MAAPLTINARKENVVIQWVMRTTAEWRGEWKVSVPRVSCFRMLAIFSTGWVNHLMDPHGASGSYFFKFAIYRGVELPKSK